jgi:DNA primase
MTTPEEQATLTKLRAGTHVVVPVEPTEAMEDAHDMAHAEAETKFADFPDLWRDLITAAQEGE